MTDRSAFAEKAAGSTFAEDIAEWTALSQVADLTDLAEESALTEYPATALAQVADLTTLAEQSALAEDISERSAFAENACLFGHRRHPLSSCWGIEPTDDRARRRANPPG